MIRSGKVTPTTGVDLSSPQHIIPNETGPNEGRKVRRAFGVALLAEAALSLLVSVLLAVQPFWLLVPAALFGTGSYLLLEPQARGLLRITFMLLAATVLVLTWLLVAG